jgi:tetratricopeptide (TPR) repeat protein
MPAWADYCIENAHMGRADLDRELAALRRTVALEPEFFTANVYLGAFLSRAARRAQPLARRALMLEGLASAMRAQQQEPTQGEGYMAEAMLREDADLARAEALYLKALGLRPSRLLWEAQAYSRLLERMGRIDDAAEQERRLLAVQPNNPFDMSHMAWDDAVRGRYDSAEQTLDRLRRQVMDPQCILGVRFEVAVLAKNWPVARAIAREPSGCGLPFGGVALVDALSSGDPALISRARAQFETLAADPATLSRFTVFALALTGDDKASLAALDRLIDRDGPAALSVVYEPSFTSVRRRPEFEALATRNGLVGYWHSSGHVPDFCRAADPPDFCRRLLVQAPKVVR